jgi:hypothetical protein
MAYKGIRNCNIDDELSGDVRRKVNGRSPRGGGSMVEDINVMYGDIVN